MFFLPFVQRPIGSNPTPLLAGKFGGVGDDKNTLRWFRLFKRLKLGVHRATAVLTHSHIKAARKQQAAKRLWIKGQFRVC